MIVSVYIYYFKTSFLSAAFFGWTTFYIVWVDLIFFFRSCAYAIPAPRGQTGYVGLDDLEMLGEDRGPKDVSI